MFSFELALSRLRLSLSIRESEYRSWRVRPESGWGWLMAGGIVTALAGVVFILGWPVNSLWLLGLFLAFDLAMQGWSLIAFGLALKR